VNDDGTGESDKKTNGRSYLGAVTKFFLGPAIKQLSHLVVTFFLAVCGIGLFILLQTVCKPYWMLGTVTPAGAESFQMQKEGTIQIQAESIKPKGKKKSYLLNP
jgi:hypothetical protein